MNEDIQKEIEEIKRLWDESGFWEKAEKLTWSLIILPFWVAGWMTLFCWPSFVIGYAFFY